MKPEGRRKNKNIRFLFSLSFLAVIFFFSSSAHAAYTIDATLRYAWSENIGWIDFKPSGGGVTVSDTALMGYAYGENIGWISLNCSNTSSCATVDYKVSNTAAGVLSGYAWSENAGWIDFKPSGSGVTIGEDGVFSGYAYGENIGWISFSCNNTNSCGTVNYGVKATGWYPENRRGGDGAGSTGAGSERGIAVEPKVISMYGGTIDKKTGQRTISVSQDGPMRLFAYVPDPDQAKKVSVKIGSKEYAMKRDKARGINIWSVVLKDLRVNVGKYPYILIGDYGNTDVRKEKGILKIVANKNLVPLSEVNKYYREVYGSNPTKAQWEPWAIIVLQGVTREDLLAQMRVAKPVSAATSKPKATTKPAITPMPKVTAMPAVTPKATIVPTSTPNPITTPTAAPATPKPSFWERLKFWR